VDILYGMGDVGMPPHGVARFDFGDADHSRKDFRMAAFIQTKGPTRVGE